MKKFLSISIIIRSLPYLLKYSYSYFHKTALESSLSPAEITVSARILPAAILKIIPLPLRGTVIPALSPKLPVPVVYNCGGYERPETLKQLEGKVDIYLPDLKYAEARLAKPLSAAIDYFPRAKNAIREMFRQVGPVQWEGSKVVKGVIIRHLILPGHVDNSLKVLDWIGNTFAPGEVLVSLMRQYTPMGGLPAPLDRRVTDEEYDAVLSWMYLNDLEGFTQEDDSASTAFIPDF